jgi:hypothetical protein
MGRIMLGRRMNAKAAKTAKNTLLGKPVHDGFDAIPQPMYVEVDEQAELEITRAESAPLFAD